MRPPLRGGPAYAGGRHELLFVAGLLAALPVIAVIVVRVRRPRLTVTRTFAPHVIPAGSGFVDDGGDVHLVRNEGSIETVVYVTSIVPRDAVRRIDEPSPGNCPF